MVLPVDKENKDLRCSPSSDVVMRQLDIPPADIVSGSNGYDAPAIGDSGAVSPAADGDTEAVEPVVEEAASDVMTRMTHLRPVLVRRSFGPSKIISFPVRFFVLVGCTSFRVWRKLLF